MKTLNSDMRLLVIGIEVLFEIECFGPATSSAEPIEDLALLMGDG